MPLGFLVDENIDRILIDVLEDEGYYVEREKRDFDKGTSDDELLKRARKMN